MISGASGKASFIAGLPAMWSTWPCVLRIAAGRSPCSLKQSRITDRGVESRIDDEGIRPPGQPGHVAELRERGRFNRFNRIVRHERSTPPASHLECLAADLVGDSQVTGTAV